MRGNTPEILSDNIHRCGADTDVMGIGSYVRTASIRAKTQLPWTQMSSKDDLITELNTAAVVMSGRYELTEALAS